MKKTLKQLRKAIVGNKARIQARVYRAETGKWEEKGTIASNFIGGLLKPIRILLRTVMGKKPNITVTKVEKRSKIK